MAAFCARKERPAGVMTLYSVLRTDTEEYALYSRFLMGPLPMQAKSENRVRLSRNGLTAPSQLPFGGTGAAPPASSAAGVAISRKRHPPPAPKRSCAASLLRERECSSDCPLSQTTTNPFVPHAPGRLLERCLDLSLLFSLVVFLSFPSPVFLPPCSTKDCPRFDSRPSFFRFASTVPFPPTALSNVAKLPTKPARNLETQKSTNQQINKSANRPTRNQKPDLSPCRPQTMPSTTHPSRHRC